MSEAPDVESRAREMGWVPEGEWKDAKAKWRPADEYVERGEVILPILRKTNEGLRGDLTRLHTENANLKQIVAETTESVESLKSFQADFTKQRVKEAKDKLLRELVQAKKDDNVEEEVRIQDELTNLSANVAAVEKEKPAVVAAPRVAPMADPVFSGWVRENDWWEKDADKTAYAQGVASSLRSSSANDHLVGRAFMDEVTKRVNTFFSSRNGNSDYGSGVDKVSPGGHSSHNGSSGNGGKSYNDLPRDAREQVEKESSRMVGPNRPFKDLKGWQDHFATLYFASE